MKILRFVSILAFSAVALAASAAPIAYTVSATATGTLNGSAFTNALVTLVAQGDTTAVTPTGATFFSVPATATLSIAGLGTYSITDALYVYSNQGAITGGLYDTTQGGTILGTSNPSFATYDLGTSFGPVSGANFIRSDLTFATSGGGFNIASAGSSTFSAQISSVPGPVAALPFALMALRRRKRG